MKRLAACVLTGVLLAGGVAIAQAQTKATELAGAKDHPLISRYAGSVLQNASTESFASVRIPGGPGRYGPDSKLAFAKSTAVEGKVSAFFYIEPKERGALEVFRNYQAALTQAGFTTLYSCEMQGCDQALIREPFPAEVVRPRKWSAGSDPAGSIDRDVRFISAKATRNGADVFVMVFVAEPNSLWQAPAAVVVVAEPAPADLGKVVITNDKLRSGLVDEGKIALYGIYFDTGRAELKPESKAQLDEMAKLLDADKSLKVSIVGHTDNQGALDANLALSQRRAESVVAALVSTYRIDAARLRARGVANFSPVATNRTDTGRSKNRRVELVEQ
jgi:outer membrane protein OmpA-like peptidoglycan-associated protein